MPRLVTIYYLNQLALLLFPDSHCIFGVTQPWSSDYKKCNPGAEIKQGRDIVDACVECGVDHLVISTVMQTTHGKTGIPHVDSKFVVDDYTRDSGVPYTFLRPAQFMDNVGQPYFPVKKGVLSQVCS